ncbi:MAG: serine hydrolase domain-containing protein [Myxococcota bacterium]
MTRTLLLLATLCGCGGGVGLESEDAGLPADPADGGLADAGLAPEIAPILAAAEADLASNVASCVSVAVWRGERVEHLFALGTAASLGGRAPDADTLFMIGSDTKKLTAAHLLQQAARGLALDVPLRELAPELRLAASESGIEATPHELLSMQSGLVDWLGPRTTGTSDGELWRVAIEEASELLYAMSPPGLFWNYSNPNYSFAGWLAERESLEPWADGIEADLFAPLGMTRTVARKASVDANHASGIGSSFFGGPAPRPVPLPLTFEDAFTRPAGLVWSTPSDQVRFAAFLVDGDPAVLPDDLREAITTPHVALTPDGERSGYGYGVFVERGLVLGGVDHPGVTLWAHGGNTPSHTSLWYVLPEQRFAISVLSNGVGDDFRATAAAAIEALVVLPEPSGPFELPFDPSVRAELAGSYLDGTNLGLVEVTEDEEGLSWEVPAFAEAEVPYEARLTPVSTRQWIAEIRGNPVVLRFYPSGEEEGAYLVARRFVAERLGAVAAPRLVGLSAPTFAGAAGGPRSLDPRFRRLP